MLVKHWMTLNPVSVNVDDSMQLATSLMKNNNIRILPVLKGQDLVGVITDRDLKRASASDANTLEIHELLYLLSKIKVGEIMSRPPITVPPDFTVEETAELLMEKKISGAPVVYSTGAVLGMITQSDLFRALVSLSGLQKRGIQIALLLEDRPGSIMQVADLIREVKGRMVSILTSYHDCPEGFRRVYFRVYNLDRLEVGPLLNRIRQVAKVMYIVDHRENRREVFIENTFRK